MNFWQLMALAQQRQAQPQPGGFWGLMQQAQAPQQNLNPMTWGGGTGVAPNPGYGNGYGSGIGPDYHPPNPLGGDPMMHFGNPGLAVPQPAYTPEPNPMPIHSRVGGYGSGMGPDYQPPAAPNPLASIPRPDSLQPNKPIGNRRVLGTMHKGGTIRQSGVYNMQKGEVVVPASKAKKAKKMMKMTGLMSK